MGKTILQDAEASVAILDAYPAPSFVVDDDVRVLFMNRAGRQVLGLHGPELESALLKRGGDLLHCVRASETPDGCGRSPTCKSCVIRNSVGKALATSEVHRARTYLQLQGPSGIADVHFLVSTAPVRHGDLQAVILTLEDVSEIVKVTKQSQKMEAVGRLASGIAHDFNNLLVVIQSCSSFLLEDLADGDPRRSDAEEISEAGQRAARLIAQLLAFARKSPEHPIRTDLNAVVCGVEKLVRRSIGENIEVSLLMTLGPWPLLIDPGQLEQLILNLVVNARDAMPDGGQLVIETANIETENDESSAAEGDWDEPPPRSAALRVSDTGCGMTEEIRSKIFEPFVTTKEVGKGTGLGLSTVFGIVQQAKGRISVESEPGKGSTFTVLLPICESGAGDELAATCFRSSRGQGAVVLLVEDEDAVRRVAQRILSRRGFRVIEARDGTEALARFAEHQVDIVLTDVVMPGLSGRELVSPEFERRVTG